MSELMCRSCGGSLVAGDRFCDKCGAVALNGQIPAPRPSQASLRGDDASESQPVSAQAYQSQPFFGHAPGQPAGFLSNATRYLCAAAYLDRRFANDVIWELIASRRAVAPSIGIDIGPVLRHCLRARKIRLIRDITLVAFGLAALFVSTIAAIEFFLVALIIWVITNTKWRQLGFFARCLVAGACVVILAVICNIILFELVGGFLGLVSLLGHASPIAFLAALALAASYVFLTVIAWATQFTYLHIAFRTLNDDLRQGASAPASRYGTTSARSARIAAVEAAQWGNMSLYGGENPFIGSGLAAGDWSIAIELDRARPANGSMTGKGPKGYVPIDPVELHAVIRERLLKLDDPGLPDNERIVGLTVNDAVVGPGELRWESPLLDWSGGLSYSQSSPEAIDALIRHPQAALRYYQRVSVEDQGQAVMSRGRPVVNGIDQGVAVSAFVYLAVEGRMFYLQLVRRALPPVRADYRLIDRMPVRSTSRFLVTTSWWALRSLPEAVILAPANLFQALRIAWRAWWLKREFSPSDGSVVGYFGAQASVRELGAADNFDSYLKRLDFQKYTKIIERLLLDTVLDFLAEKGVDISAFATSASSIINGDVVNVGAIYGGGNQIGGQGNQMSATPARASAAG